MNLTSENPAVLEAGTQLDFTFSVAWQETETSFDDRFRKYLDKSFFEHQIHWFSIFNSFMMVIFLVGLVSLILMRTLKRDYARFKLDDEDGDRFVMTQLYPNFSYYFYVLTRRCFQR